MRSLRMKLVMIMVILILALMSVVGAFLINGVGNFYISEFYVQMNQTFSPEFITQLQRIAAQESAAPERMKELLMAQAGLGIDISNRNVFVLDETGGVLASSNGEEAVSMSTNLLTAMNGAVGQESSISSSTMDLAVPIETDTQRYIVYILDAKATVDALTSEVLGIIIKALALGLVICLVLSVLLAQILITPLRALTRGTRQVAAGDFEQRLDAASNDEIGVLTRNFNYMAQVLQDTISEAENERNKLSTLFLHMTDGVVAFSAAGTVIHFNPAATQMLSRQLDPTTTFDEIFGEEAELDTLLTLKRPQYIERQKTVGERELELFLAPFSSDQTQGGVLVVIHDVTEQRKSEQSRREFVANVSHELRTPLTNIKSYAETIVSAGDELPGELRTNFLGVIINEADRMTRIVQDLLTLSKIDYGKMEMNISRFSFAQAAQNVYEAARLNAEQNHHHTMTCTCEDNIPEVNGDRERIEQVVMNIVSNAIKYTPDGGKIEIHVGTGKKTVYVRVTDNGIGIPEKDLPRLFERFYRVDTARSRESGGTGLGLSIAREILQQHKGDIHIDSVYGEGTDVVITLPAAV
ncbi:MAG: cell wall metabolism sensor histidine kinase WalK [Clostridiales bacterium]|nr:cell wall metabolism sensor histidine kinase WalK [Clostridiales bacterium]